jgi:hypothetical protein
LFLLAGCNGGDSTGSRQPYDLSNPEPGDELVWQIGQGDEILYEIKMKAELVEAPVDGAPAVVMWFCEDVVNHVPAELSSSAFSPNDEFDAEDVISFLETYWDEYFEGLFDPGSDAYEFAQYLFEHEMTHQDFIALALAFEGDFAEFMAALEALDALDPDEGDDLADLLLYLRANELTFNEFLATLAEHGMALDEFVDSMKAYGLDFISLCNMDEEKVQAAGVKFYRDAAGELDAVDPTKFAGVLKDLNGIIASWAKMGLDVAKFAWTVIKDGKPEINADGLSTSILSAKDKDPMNYAGSKTMTSPAYWLSPFLVADPVFAKSMCAAEWYGHIDYAAQNPEFGGYYIPNLMFDVNWVHAFWSYSIDMTAVMGKPVNVGTIENPDPKFLLNNHMRAGNFIFLRMLTLKWEAIGSKGLFMKGIHW